MANKIYHHCPRCGAEISQQRNIQAVSVCNHCSWAGSYRSENFDFNVQCKVSVILILLGLVFSFGIVKVKHLPGKAAITKLAKIKKFTMIATFKRTTKHNKIAKYKKIAR